MAELCRHEIDEDEDNCIGCFVDELYANSKALESALETALGRVARLERIERAAFDFVNLNDAPGELELMAFNELVDAMSVAEPAALSSSEAKGGG